MSARPQESKSCLYRGGFNFRPARPPQQSTATICSLTDRMNVPTLGALSRSGIAYKGKLGETAIAVKVASGESTKHFSDSRPKNSPSSLLNPTLFTLRPQAQARGSTKIQPRATL